MNLVYSPIVDNRKKNMRSWFIVTIKDAEVGVLKPSSVVDQALAYLRRLILEGKLAQGERLVETDLATQLGVSRATVREALRHLEVEGMVQTQPWRGTYVSRLSQKDAEDICIARALIEGYAIRTSVRHITDQELAELQAVTDAMRLACARRDVYTVAELDAQFHRLLCARADNRRLTDLHRTLDSQIGALIMATLDASLLPIEQAAERHQELLDTLRTRDPVRSERAVQEHYLAVRALELD